MSKLPITIRDEIQLDDLLSDPSPSAIQALQQIDGDIMLLGAGGKMGPSLARMVRRASVAAGSNRRVIAVSRFSNRKVPVYLSHHGVETLSGDLLSESFLDSLPDVPNIILMTGAKFGTFDNASLTWAVNVLLPALVCRRFHLSRILGFSTGNVYPFVDTRSDGSIETDELEPVGEYAMSAVGRAPRACIGMLFSLAY